MQAPPKIPVFVVAGWLGAGKTSFLNHLLVQTAGLKIGVLVNDFGDINIDTGLIDRQVDELVSLSNGCLCCTLSNELDDSLNQLTAGDTDLDAIFVEASGIADPAQMAKLIFDSKNPHISFSDIIYLVDAVNFQQLLSDKEYIARMGLSVSTLILINKIDQASSDAIALIESQIREINPEAIILRTKQAKIDSRLLFDLTEKPNIQLRLGQIADQVEHHHHDHDHDNENYQQASFSTDQPLDPLTTTPFLNHLPSGVYRAKGWLNFGAKCPKHKLVFQKVGRYHQLQAIKWDDKEKRSTELVFIGPDFDQAKLDRELKNCIDKNPDHVTPENTVTWQQFI